MEFSKKGGHGSVLFLYRNLAFISHYGGGIEGCALRKKYLIESKKNWHLKFLRFFWFLGTKNKDFSSPRRRRDCVYTTTGRAVFVVVRQVFKMGFTPKIIERKTKGGGHKKGEKPKRVFGCQECANGGVAWRCLRACWQSKYPWVRSEGCVFASRLVEAWVLSRFFWSSAIRSFSSDSLIMFR